MQTMNSTKRKNFRNSAGFRLLKAPVTLWLRDTLGWEQAEGADVAGVVAYLEQRRAGGVLGGVGVPIAHGGCGRLCGTGDVVEVVSGAVVV